VDPNGAWRGSVWRFTTRDWVLKSVVDDFEDYNDYTNLIYMTWVDGYGSPSEGVTGNGSGATVGNLDAPYAETRAAYVHSGRQSMPMEYKNGSEPWYSEAERRWGTPQDWTVDGADTLTLYFRGDCDNGRDKLYVGIEDSAGRIAVVTHPDANAVFTTQWQKWHIALADVQAVGVEAGAVKRMYIGVGDRKNPQPDGAGRIYIDDIRLTYRNLVVGDSNGDALDKTIHVLSPKGRKDGVE